MKTENEALSSPKAEQPVSGKSFAGLKKITRFFKPCHTKVIVLLVLLAVMCISGTYTLSKYYFKASSNSPSGKVAKFDVVVTKSGTWSNGNTDATYKMVGSKTYSFTLENKGQVNVRARAVLENTPYSTCTLSNSGWFNIAKGTSVSFSITVPTASRYSGTTPIGNQAIMHFEYEQLD
jgi:hypothetical protein